MFLLILESLGTAELLVIGLVALMIFGPRKLPEMMRKAGKVAAEFRKTTSDFKETWEKEVSEVSIDLEEEEKKKLLPPENPAGAENTIGRISETEKESLKPEIKEVDQDLFDLDFSEKELSEENFQNNSSNGLEEVRENLEVKEVNKEITDKRDWF